MSVGEYARKIYVHSEKYEFVARNVILAISKEVVEAANLNQI